MAAATLRCRGNRSGRSCARRRLRNRGLGARGGEPLRPCEQRHGSGSQREHAGCREEHHSRDRMARRGCAGPAFSRRCIRRGGQPVRADVCARPGNGIEGNVAGAGTRLVVAVWSDSPAYSALAEIAHRQGAEQVAASFEDPFDLGDQAKALDLFNDAGIRDVRLETRDGSVRFASIDEFIRVEIRGWILADALDEAAYEALLAEARHRLAEFCESDGRIVFPMNAHIITAHKS